MSESSSLNILHLSDEAVVVDKPIGMASIPEAAGDPCCLQARLERQLGGRVWVVHRLDKEVSGAILFARHATAHRFLNMAFEQRRVTKLYVAGAAGEVSGEAGEITLPLREFGSGRVGVDPVKGKPCVTRWRVLERRAGRTLLEMEPFTGRRHQLRAHAYAIGHPLLGDSRYGDKITRASHARLLLHARLIDFPTTGGERVTVVSEPDSLFDQEWRGTAGQDKAGAQ